MSLATAGPGSVVQREQPLVALWISPHFILQMCGAECLVLLHHCVAWELQQLQVQKFFVG